MKPVFQTMFGKEDGDCHRASIASLFNLKIEQVPHFRLFPDEVWSYVLSGFLWGLGYDWDENGCTNSHQLSQCESINGYFEACVPSGNHSELTHSVIINRKGVVVHDPHPEQSWVNKNVLRSGDLQHWMIIKKHQKNILCNS